MCKKQDTVIYAEMSQIMLVAIKQFLHDFDIAFQNGGYNEAIRNESY